MNGTDNIQPLRMKYHVGQLFKVETNEGFRWLEFPSSSEIARSALLSVAKDYGVQGCEGLLVLEKPNKLSNLYRLKTDGDDYIFRAVSESEARLVEEQCRVAHEVNYPHMIRPNPNRKGHYVTLAHGSAWTNYDYHEGELFSGEPGILLEIIEECLKFIRDLERLNGKYELFRVPHKRNEWIHRFHSFLNSDRFDKTRFGRLLSEPLQTLLSENQREIEALVQKLASLDLTREVSLTHNDLNHANIIVQEGEPFFLDLEDICFENLRISAVHCIFKLLRHSVYTGNSSPEEIQEELLSTVLKSRGLKNLGIQDSKQLYLLGEYRIVSDIHLILERMSQDAGTHVAIDLEKKLMNLFELHFLTWI